MNLAALQRRINDWVWTPAVEAWWVRHLRRSLAVMAPVAAVSGGRTRRLYIDVSIISQHDAGTGIQRVVRAVATHLQQSPPANWQVVPVAATSTKAYTPLAWPNGHEARLPPAIDIQAGDVFLGLDFALSSVYQHRRQLQAFQRQGMQTWFVMYDLLPAQRPDWFSDTMVLRFRQWLRVVSGLANGFFCISATVADDLRQYLRNRFQLTDLQLPNISVMPMGWDIRSAPHSEGTTATAQQLLKTLEGHASALMVGTLEPRKGHADVLAAFDYIWQQGQKIHLVIIGRPGWKTQDLQCKIKQNPEYGKYLHWLTDATDEDLEQIYRACTGVIAASYAEGFGLPILEAMRYCKPILARDIPVFHSLESGLISYSNEMNHALIFADQIVKWIEVSLFMPIEVFNADLKDWADVTAFIGSHIENTN